MSKHTFMGLILILILSLFTTSTGCSSSPPPVATEKLIEEPVSQRETLQLPCGQKLETASFSGTAGTFVHVTRPMRVDEVPELHTVTTSAGSVVTVTESLCPTTDQKSFEKVSTIPEVVPPTPVMRTICLPTEKGQECSVVRSDEFNCNFDYACTTDGLREMKRTEKSPDMCIGFYTCVPMGEKGAPKRGF